MEEMVDTKQTDSRLDLNLGIFVDFTFFSGGWVASQLQEIQSAAIDKANEVFLEIVDDFSKPKD